MNPWPSFGKLLIAAGVVLIITGALLLFKDRLPLGLGRLPGDMSFEKGNFRFYFPLGTSIVISIILTLVLSLWKK